MEQRLGTYSEAGWECLPMHHPLAWIVLVMFYNTSGNRWECQNNLDNCSDVSLSYAIVCFDQCMSLGELDSFLNLKVVLFVGSHYSCCLWGFSTQLRVLVVGYCCILKWTYVYISLVFFNGENLYYFLNNIMKLVKIGWTMKYFS